MARFQPNYPRQPGYPDHTILTVPERCAAPTDVTGRGVTIAFVDSGFYPHPDLSGRVRYVVDATSAHIQAWRRFDRPAWYSWHGQMTSVIAAGDGGSGRAFPGIARESRVVLIKVSTVHGRIKERDILRGFRWLVENHRRFGIRVVNVSVGGDFESRDPNHPLHQAVEQLSAEGVVVCVAAGNIPLPRLVPPASAPSAITVGGYSDENSLDPAARQPYPSSWGVAYDGTPKPELLAPARWIASPILPKTAQARRAYWLAQLLEVEADSQAARRILRAGYTDLGLTQRQVLYPDSSLYTAVQRQIDKDKIIDANHQHVDGTSVAVAIVSSIVAQLLEVRPDLTPGEVKALLTAAAETIPRWPRERQGGGIVSPAKAQSNEALALLPI